MITRFTTGTPRSMIINIIFTVALLLLSTTIPTVSAGRLEHLLNTDVNPSYASLHHKPQPRLCRRHGGSTASDNEDCVLKTSRIVPGPATPLQRRNGWVWVVEEASTTNAKPASTSRP